MKTENDMYILVFIRADEVVVALEFEYETAKEILINTINKVLFDLQADDGLIFKLTHSGIAEPIYNYRSHHLSKEPEIYKPGPKRNDSVKIFFKCPECGSYDGALEVDEDGDILMRCQEKSCDYLTIVK